MGIIPTPNYSAGDQCTSCFGIGKTFGDVPTPARIKVVFSGMESCPGKGGPTGGTFILEQGIDPCYYHYGLPDGTTVYVNFFDISGGGEYTGVYWGGSGINYFNGITSKCSTEVGNEFTLGACSLDDTGSYGGSAEIFWGPEI